MTLKHAKLSASGSAQWLACSGSVAAQKGFKSTTNSAAEIGTAIHQLGEMMLTDPDFKAAVHIGKCLSDAPTTPITQDMIDMARSYYDYCIELVTATSVLFAEDRVDFSQWVPEGFGTSDCIIIDGELAHIIDLKTGRNPVSVENNSQAMLYALGVLSDYGCMFDIERFVLHIYQPTINNISTWEISTADLLKWADWVEERAKLCLEDNAQRTAGEAQCQWCKAAPTCDTLREHVEKTINSQFDDLDLDDPKYCNIGNVLKNKKLVESFLKAVEEYAYQQLLDGEQIDGFKLVAGKSNRRWINEEEASKVIQKQLGEKAFTAPKLLSVAQAEKAIGKDFKALEPKLVIKPEGLPVIAPADDRRPAIESIIEMFD